MARRVTNKGPSKMHLKFTAADDVRNCDTKGAADFRYIDGKLMGCGYRCPGCGEEDYLPINNGERGWTFSGSEESPTLHPSIEHRSCKWHGYLEGGTWRPA